MHWFEPYIFSFLLCRTKTVKKVSITDEIIALMQSRVTVVCQETTVYLLKFMFSIVWNVNIVTHVFVFVFLFVRFCLLIHLRLRLKQLFLTCLFQKINWDQQATIVFPFIFLIFNVSYWLHYLWINKLWRNCLCKERIYERKQLRDKTVFDKGKHKM